MKEPFTFYRALDPVKGSWDGYGFQRFGEANFIAFVTDAPSAASIHTPELISDFWTKYARENFQVSSTADIARFELADGINRLHDHLQRKTRIDGSGYQATLSIARKIGNQLFYCSVGDSMLQLYRDGVLYRLNHAEIWDGSMIFKESQRLLERQKTDLLRFVGDGGEFVSASAISALSLEKGDRLILTTDGVEDLLSPDRLIPILKLTSAAMRTELENVFIQEKLRDDVTFLAVDVEIEETTGPDEHIERMMSQIDSLRKEQSAFRNDLALIGTAAARLERIEKGLTQLVQQVQSQNKKIETLGKANRPASAYSIRREQSSFKKTSLWAAGAVLFALLLVWGYAQWSRPSATRVTRITQPALQPQPRSRSVAPPEISEPVNCTYIIEKGDSLEKIAAKKNVEVDSLLSWNPSLKRNSALRIGEKISICDKGE